MVNLLTIEFSQKISFCEIFTKSEEQVLVMDSQNGEFPDNYKDCFYVWGYHVEDCCESAWIDWSGFDDTGFKTDSFTKLDFKINPGNGIVVNEFFVPCYSANNGYYSDNLTLNFYIPFVVGTGSFSKVTYINSKYLSTGYSMKLFAGDTNIYGTPWLLKPSVAFDITTSHKETYGS